MHQLDHMLKARSVAVVGASGRPGSVGDQTLRQLRAGGFEGPVYPVNPGYDELMGLQCHRSIGMIDKPIDLAVLAVANARLEDETERALAAGARSLAIFASCHGTAREGGSLKDRIAVLTDAADVPVCGGNGMGFLNLDAKLRICGFFQPETLVPGGITFLSHSGSMFSAMLHNKRGLGFNLVVSTGLELNTRMSDYLDWALQLETTRVIALFMETVRDPERFLAALDRARESSIPVIALKVGATGRAQAAVATHSESIAGDDLVYRAVFDGYGVHRVQSMDEMADTIELMSSPRRVVRGGLGAVHDSGGERALLIDTAERVGVSLPTLAQPTVSALTDLLDPGLEPANPVDAWGTGRDAERVFIGCLEALASDPAVGVVAFSVDLTEEEGPDDTYGLAALEAANRIEKPLAVLANLSAAVDRAQARAIRAGGVPVLEGTETGLRAIRHLLDRAEWERMPPMEDRLTTEINWPAGDVRPGEILDRYGIKTAGSIEVSGLESAVDAASRLGYPVVMKTAGTEHKTEVSGVLLGLDSADQVASAYRDLSRRLGPRVSVSEQVGPGVEIALGMVRDPQFGPVLLISAGGTLIELLQDHVAALPRLDPPRAEMLIRSLEISRLLLGHRGTPPVDLSLLSRTVARFSELALDAPDEVVSIDINPLIVSSESVTAVDVLVKPS